MNSLSVALFVLGPQHPQLLCIYKVSALDSCRVGLNMSRDPRGPELVLLVLSDLNHLC